MLKKGVSFFLILSLLVTPFLAEGEISASSNITFEDEVSVNNDNYVMGEVIVTVVSEKDTTLTTKGDVSFDSELNVEDSWNFGTAEFLSHSADTTDFLSQNDYRVSLVTSDKYTTEELITKLKSKSYVISVEPNYYQTLQSLTTDPYVESQWHLSNRSTGILPDNAFQKTKAGTPIVAVIDTGIDYTHEDLAGQMWINPYNAKGLPGTYGYDCGDYDSDPMDTEGHGTHCAGIIAATANNGVGTCGIANAKLMAIKTFNYNGESATSNIVSALNYLNIAMDCGANVVAVNCSWGGGTSSGTLSNLVSKISAAGALFSFSSGNDGTNVETTKLVTPYDMTNDAIITVGASNANGNAASYSSYGPSKVTLFAPGDMILSTVIEDTLLPDIYSESQRANLLTYYDTADTFTTFPSYTAGEPIGEAGLGLSDSIQYDSSVDTFSGNSGCYKWILTNSSYLKRTSFFCLDITDLNLNSRDTFYVSSMLATDESGQTPSWVHKVMKSTATLSGNRFVKYNGRTYLRIMGVTVAAGKSQTVYVDEIAISKANPNTSAFGKYEYESGTSMAAPMVSGAIASLASIYPNDSPRERRLRLLQCTRTNGSLIGKCSTASLLDLSKLDNYVALDSLSLSVPSTSVKVTKKLQFTAVPNPANSTNNAVTWSVNNNSYASINSQGLFTALAKGGGKTVMVTATSCLKPSVTVSIKIKIATQKATKIKLNKTNLKLKVGKKKQLKATVTPSTTTNKKITWSSSNRNYATVSKSGLVTAKKKGKTVKIYAKTKDGSKKKAYCIIKIIK